MDATLNLPEDIYSHGIRRHVAQGVAKESFDEVVEQLANMTGAPVHKRQVEELAARAAQDYESFYATRPANDTEDRDKLLILTFDGKGIAMRREDLRPATRKAADETPHKLQKWLSSVDEHLKPRKFGHAV